MKPLITSPLGVHHSLSGDERSANPTTIRVQRERPILMSGPMVRALIAGNKTQTRRIIKRQPSVAVEHNGWPVEIARLESGAWGLCHGGVVHECVGCCPFGDIGDRLWVREAFRRHDGFVTYRADCTDVFNATYGRGFWTPSIHMPRAASRITLEITAVRVERLNDITEEDAKTEGADAPSGRLGGYPAPWATSKPGPLNYRDSYRRLWDSINGKGSWAKNPWVWRIAFRKVTP